MATLEKPSYSQLEMREVDHKEFDKYIAIIDSEDEKYSMSKDENFKRYMERTFRKPFTPNGDYIVFLENGEPRGYVRFKRRKKIIDLGRIAVHQDHRGKGYGKRIMEMVKDMAKEEGRKLIVGTTSDIQDFFLKCGLKTGEADPWEAWLSYE